MTMTLDQSKTLLQGSQIVSDRTGERFEVVSIEQKLFQKVHIELIDLQTQEKTYINETDFDVMSAADDATDSTAKSKKSKAKDKVVPDTTNQPPDDGTTDDGQDQGEPTETA